jgi:protein arginine kinase activator
MMICQQCKKNVATTNFIEIVGGESFELHLCDKCYAQKYGEFEEQATGAMLSGLFGEQNNQDKVCEVCGMRFSDYEKTGLLGCPSCYDVFKEELLPSIARIQGQVRHIGREGGDYSSEHDLRMQLRLMQDKLEGAIRAGDYAEAGRLNDKMKAIKKKLGGGKSNG